MSHVHGGYGFMLQLPEAVAQQAVTAFVAANPKLFEFQAQPEAALARYGIHEWFALGAKLVAPSVKFIEGREIELSFGVDARVHISTRFDPLPNGAQPDPAPDVDAAVGGQFTIRVRASYRSVGSQRFLALDLRYFSVVALALTVDSSTVVFSDRAKAVLAAVTRREILYTLTNRVGEIPATFTFTPSIPFLDDQSVALAFDYKVVTSGNERALALLCEVQGMAVNWDAVSYGLTQPQDIGLFLDTGLINRALDQVEHFLEDLSLEKQEDITHPKRFGWATINDARFHVDPGRFVIDNCEVHIRVIDQIQRTIRKVVCYLLGGACGIDVCDTILETVMEEVLQLDQVAHADGWLGPAIKKRSLTFESHLHLGLANWLWVSFAALFGFFLDLLLPAGMLISPVLMIIGNMLLDRRVNHLVNEKSIDTLISKEIPGAHLKVIAYARAVAWPDNCLAVMAAVEFNPV